MKWLGYSPVPTSWKLVHKLKVWRLSFLAFWFPHLKNGDINTYLLGLLWRLSATTYVEHGAQESDGCNYYFIIIISISLPLLFPSVFLTTPTLLSLPLPNYLSDWLLPLPPPLPFPSLPPAAFLIHLPKSASFSLSLSSLLPTAPSLLLSPLGVLLPPDTRIHFTQPPPSGSAADCRQAT